MGLSNALTATVQRQLRRLNVKVARDRAMRDPIRLLHMKALAAGVETVLDIGANTGQFGADFRGTGWRGRIVSFEPLAAAHATLATRAQADGPDWIVAPPMAIGAADGEAEINVAANSVSSSLLPVEQRSVDVAAASRFAATQTVQVRALDSAMQPAWAGPFAMKVDTQGFELEVLRGAPATLAQTKVAMLEMSLTPLYRGGASFAELYAYMEQAGFRCIALTEGFADYAHDEVLQVDGVFVRD